MILNHMIRSGVRALHGVRWSLHNHPTSPETRAVQP